jgi:hypothetical protein
MTTPAPDPDRPAAPRVGVSPLAVGLLFLVPACWLAVAMHQGGSSYVSTAHGAPAWAPRAGSVALRYLLVAIPTLLLAVRRGPRWAALPVVLCLIPLLGGHGTVLTGAPPAPLSTPDLWIPDRLIVVIVELALLLAPAAAADLTPPRLSFPRVRPRALVEGARGAIEAARHRLPASDHDHPRSLGS